MPKPNDVRRSTPLEGEDITTEHWEDARHWLSVYADLLEFKATLLARVERDISKLPGPARHAAAVDLAIIENQRQGYQERLDLWYQRAWDLQGLWVDPDGRVVRHQGREATLTQREHQLLNFLLDHPHRYFTAAQILEQAWSDPGLFPDAVRNYIHRLRRIMKQLGVPARIVNRPKRGYSLIFDAPR